MALTTVRATWWSITINNPTENDRNRLETKANWPSFVKFWKAQDEVGENRTPHIQGALQTAQIRASAIKEWLPRAHIEVARNKKALLDYVEKSDTAVPGTQVVIQADYLSMDVALKEIAKHTMDYLIWAQGIGRGNIKDKAFEKYEFWNAVREILKERPKAVGLFTNPQLERAWLNTRSVWIELLEKDRQTDRQNEILDAEEISPADVYEEDSSPPSPPCP